jgi:hypothetical protein
LEKQKFFKWGADSHSFMIIILFGWIKVGNSLSWILRKAMNSSTEYIFYV